MESIVHSLTETSNPQETLDDTWNELLLLAEHHGVLALAAHNLTTHVRKLPLPIRQSLESAYTANLRRSLWFTAELMRIMRHFAGNNLRALPYKGPALAQSAYGDLALRSFSDLDLLIGGADFSLAKKALADLGYHPSENLSPAVERLWLRTGYERSFDGAAGKNLVELQWSLLPYFYAIDGRSGGFQFEDLFERARSIPLAGTGGSLSHDQVNSIPCLSPEDSLLVLCLHAAKHLWTRLIWIADVAETLRTPGIDIAAVFARARALGITRILAVSLWLAENLVSAPISSTARTLLPPDPEVALIGQQCAERMRRAATYNFESGDYFWHTLKLRERSSDRARYLWRLVTTPGPGEVAAVTLPEAMFPLYRVVRMGRLLRKLI